MILSPTEISNLALDGELAAATITGWSENTLQANTARRHYPVCLAELLEASDWGFARTRVALAQEDENDRDPEWAVRYALPTNVGMMIRLLPPYDVSDDNYTPLVGQRLVYPTTPSTQPGLPYDWAGGFLYAQTEGAILEYVEQDATSEGGSARFIRALTLLLAARFAMPIKKDASLRDKLRGEYEIERDRAIALNANSRPQRYGNFVSDAVLAREGWTPGYS
jgi:hypothetical protein